MKSAPSLILASIAALVLSACGSEKPAGKATAGGEILEGSTSDAMLPLDSVRSQPPLAPRATESGKPKDSSEKEGGDASPVAAEPAPPPADDAAAAPPARPSAE